MPYWGQGTQPIGHAIGMLIIGIKSFQCEKITMEIKLVIVRESGWRMGMGGGLGSDTDS